METRKEVQDVDEEKNLKNLLAKQSLFKFGSRYNYDEKTKQHMKEIVEKYFKRLLDDRTEATHECRATYHRFLEELKTMTDEQVKKLNDAIQDDPETLINFMYMPIIKFK